MIIRSQKVMLVDHAVLYGIETKSLKRAVRRQITRFPEDFMFELTKTEALNLRSQTVTSRLGKEGWGGLRYMPYAFTEQGVEMLSSVLR